MIEGLKPYSVILPLRKSAQSVDEEIAYPQITQIFADFQKGEPQ
jgi:hypothetical protein